MMGAAGAGGDRVYIDDLFSMYPYLGSGGNKTITNGIDLAGEGGMVWVKSRQGTDPWRVSDTERGTTLGLNTSDSQAEFTESGGLKNFYNTGFRVGNDAQWNGSNTKFISWSFRNCPGFFDVVTYTGTGSTQAIAHNLGSTPGFICVKRRDGNDNWSCFHREMDSSAPQDYAIKLNYDEGRGNSQSAWNDTAPSSTHFTVKSDWEVNGNGATYVAYVFAHDAAEFGTNSDKSVIYCGSYTGNGSTSGPNINIGWEPQWLLIKNVTTTSGRDWELIDSMRGASKTSRQLRPNDAAGESNVNILELRSTGFEIYDTNAHFNENGERFIYVAIRRPDGYVGKPVEAATDVFAMDAGNGSTTPPAFDSNFTADCRISKEINSTSDWWINSRLALSDEINSNNTDAGGPGSWTSYDTYLGEGNSWTSAYQGWLFKRHSGFDVVIYNGISGVRQIQHSLGKPAEMIWIKRTDGTDEWAVGHSGLDSGGWNKYLKLNSTDAEANAYGTFNSTAPTATHFSLSTSSRANWNGQEYIAFLFASVEGISKVGSYDGSNSAITVTTGFQPRFIIIKVITDNAAGWVVLDTTRGWGSGNDATLELNTQWAQATNLDRGAPTSTGFTIPAANVAGVNRGPSHKYIYYAHA